MEKDSNKITSIFGKKEAEESEPKLVTKDYIATQAREKLEEVIKEGARQIIIVAEGKTNFVMHDIPESVFASYGAIFLLYERMMRAASED